MLKEDGRDTVKLEAALRHFKEKPSDYRMEERKKVIHIYQLVESFFDVRLDCTHTGLGH